LICDFQINSHDFVAILAYYIKSVGLQKDFQMSTVHAMEHAFGVTVDGQLRELRRLLYCGEWIESHVLHIYMLHAPDFLGYPDVMRMAQDYPDIVKRALQMKKAGNAIVALLGGERSIQLMCA